jgi:hypothetical protein
MLKTCFVCGIARNSFSFAFLLVPLSLCLLLLLFVSFMLLLHPHHSCLIFFRFIMSFFLYKHISQLARLLLPALTWNCPSPPHTHGIHSSFTLCLLKLLLNSVDQSAPRKATFVQLAKKFPFSHEIQTFSVMFRRISNNFVLNHNFINCP